LQKLALVKGLFSNMDVEPFIQKLSLLFDMCLGIPHNFDDAFEIGQLTTRNNERLLVQEDGMCTNPTLNMSLEKALFPFHMDVGHMMELVVYCLI
jgi:hypothetical protein